MFRNSAYLEHSKLFKLKGRYKTFMTVTHKDSEEISLNMLAISWAPSVDNKKEFYNVTRFQITITSFDQPINNTFHFALEDNSLVYLTWLM